MTDNHWLAVCLILVLLSLLDAAVSAGSHVPYLYSWGVR